MDPQIPTSFIPKRPVTTEVVPAKTHSRAIGLLSIVTVALLLAVGAAYGGVSLYAKRLDSQKAALQKQINEARNNIGTDFLTDMKRLNQRIEGVKSLVGTHIVVSPIFAALEQTTLRSIQFKSFTYAFVIDPGTKGQMVQATLAGTAKTYAAIALQSDAFAKNTLIKNPVFSNLTVDDKTGLVGFKLVFTVAPGDLSYEKFITDSTKSATTAPLVQPTT
jgi:hypothetical protein